MTELAPLNPDPVITTLVLTPPLVGEKDVIFGVTLKFAVLVAVPTGVVTLIFPVVASEGTVAVILMDELTVKLAVVPLNLTRVAPLKFAPLMTTLVPTLPLVGVKLVIRGATTKSVEVVAVPAGLVTVIFPVVAPVGTVAVILTALLTV